MVEAVVEYDYDAVNPDELTLKEGEIITDINMLEEGWWEGELNGKRGMFPDNFVKVIKDDKSDRRSSNAKSKAPGPPVNGDTASIHSSHSQGSQDTTDVVKREGSNLKRQIRAKVAFSYHPENEDELSLEVDDIIEVTGQPEDGWWEGMLKGSRGVFPSNFVTVIEGDESNMEVANGKEDKADSPDSEPKEQQQPPPVKPQRPISIHKGSEEPKVSERRNSEFKEELQKEDDLPAPRQTKPIGGKPVGGVGFGNIFAAGSVHLRKTNPDTSKAKKSEPPKRPELSEMAQKRQSLRKPLHAPDDVNKKEKKGETKPEKKVEAKPEKKVEAKPEKKEEEKEEKQMEEIEIVGKNGSKPVKPPDAPPVVEKARVLFDYEAQNPDELTMMEGDIIVIISKEAGDSGWWKGELNGKQGVFPDNFVNILPPERIKKKVPTPVPARPNAGPKAIEEHKPQTASKPRRGSREPPPVKPQPIESEPPKEPAIKEEPQSKPQLPPGAKTTLPVVPPKKPNLKKPPPPKPLLSSADKETREAPKRPPSFVDKDQLKEKVPEKKESPVEMSKTDKPEATFDEIKPKTEKLTHPNLNRPRNVNKRPPSVFGAVPGVTVNDGDNQHDHAPVIAAPRLPTPDGTNNPAQPPWARDRKRTSVRRPSPLALSSDKMQDGDEAKTVPPRRSRKSRHARPSNVTTEKEHTENLGLKRRPAWKPIENDIAGPPARPKTTPSPLAAPPAPVPAAKQETSPVTSPGNSRPASMGPSEQQNAPAASAAMLAAMEDLKKEVKAMQEQMTNMRTEFKKEVKKLMVEVDEEKKLRLSMQVELERIKKLVLDS